MSSWIAAATSYSTNNRIMIPFYIYYSMFGFQRIGDLAWAAGDMQARGFLLGGTAGRTTLNGEGLQHQDGHSHILSATIPNCVSYDPTFAYELAVIMQDGLKRMIEQQENVYYYITLMNENYPHPGLKSGQEEGIIKGMYLFSRGNTANKTRVQLLGSGTILREVIAAAELLDKDWGVAADVWSCPSFTELAREGDDVARQNLLQPDGEGPPVVRDASNSRRRTGPIVASTDYMKLFAEQIRAYVPKGRSYRVLGTDGFGRSDTRAKLRAHFEVDRHYVVVAALKALSEEGTVPAAKVADAMRKYDDRPGQAQSRDRLSRHAVGRPAAARLHPVRRVARPAAAPSDARVAARATTRPITRNNHGNDRAAGPRHRRLQGRRGDRGAGQAGRHGRGRAVADHDRERQGVDGDPVVGAPA